MYQHSLSAVCLGSHRVGINHQDPGCEIPSDLRTCVKGFPFIPHALLINKHWHILCGFWLNPVRVLTWQRSVTSARRFHATRRVRRAVWMAWPPSLVCANPAGGGHAVRMVSTEYTVYYIEHTVYDVQSVPPILSHIESSSKGDTRDASHETVETHFL